MNFSKIFFHYYPARVKAIKPLGAVTIFDMLKANSQPNDKLKKAFRLIAIAESYGNEKRKAFVKQNFLYYFTPCVYSNGLGRKYSDILLFTGFLVLDFDHIENAEEFKYFLFERYKCIIAAILSPSKKGVKFIVRIPKIETKQNEVIDLNSDCINEFKAYFFGIAVEMQKYKGFDGTGQNCILPLFLSYDPDLLFRDDPEEWNKKGKNIKEFKTSEVQAIKIDATDHDKATVQKIIMSAVNKIVSEGHPQIRAAAVTLGGYVATGYIDQIEAENFINSLIANNSYLRKGVAGYQRTAKSAIQLGMQSQLFLK